MTVTVADLVARTRASGSHSIQTLTAYVNFTCPCGAWDIVMTEARDPLECDCGRLYEFKAELKVIRGPRGG